MGVRTEEQEVQKQCSQRKKVEVILFFDNIRKSFYSSFGKVRVELVMSTRKTM